MRDFTAGLIPVVSPSPGDRPSNVIVVHGINASISAIMFHCLTTDRFSQARVAPVDIVNGQGRMWVRFETASEGLRALGAAARLGQSEAAYFSSDSEFHDAATYSRDQWTLESEDVEMAPPPPAAASGTTSPGPSLLHEATPATPATTAVPSDSPIVAVATAAAETSPSPAPTASTTPAASRESVREPPRALRAMMREAASSMVKPSLEERLLDSAVTAPTPLADRLSDPPASLAPPLPTPLAQRLARSAPPLASRLSEPEEEPPSKRQKLAADPTLIAPSSASPSPSTPPSKRKRRGTRAGRLVKEQRAAREKCKAEAEALAAQAEATGDTSLLAWIPTLAVVAEEEAREMGEIDGTAGWSHEGDDDDDDAPIAGPFRWR
ncbi:hypothetical protein DFH09DRAFT_1107809 [Mycena vulgaris]|nr:hypothetical protein DFH09DRAFT_1107809 [Mycena vulgaris]